MVFRYGARILPVDMEKTTTPLTLDENLQMHPYNVNMVVPHDITLYMLLK
jgi:hypothetical protein